MTYSQTYDQGSLFMDYMNAKTYLESHRDDCIPSFALAPYSAGYITERLQTRVIVVILDPKTLVIIAGPNGQLTPVNNSDPTGHMAVEMIMLLIGIGVGATIGATVSAVSQYLSNGGWDNFSWALLGWNTLIGAAGGALAMSTLGAGAMIVANGALGAVGSIGSHLIAGDDFGSPEVLGDVVISTVAGLVAGLLGGSGAMHNSNIAVVRAASGVVKASTSYFGVLTKATSGGYATLRGAHIALGITRNNLTHAWNEAFTMIVGKALFKSLVANAVAGFGGAFASGAWSYGW